MMRTCDFCGGRWDRDATALYCMRCAYIHNYIKGINSSAVRKAIVEGRLLSPKEFACTDCNAPASRYDHRYNARPLQVEPVCRRCDNLRGPAEDCDEAMRAVINNPNIRFRDKAIARHAKRIAQMLGGSK